MKRAAREAVVTGGSLLLASPLLLLIGGAVVALVLAASPGEVAKQIHQDAVKDALWLSLKTTLVSLVLILVFGTAWAILLHRARGIWAGFLELLVTLPAVMPPSVAGIALLLAFGREGLIGASLDRAGIQVSFSAIAVVMAQTFVATPFYVREAATAFGSVDSSVLDAAKVDGASGWSLFRGVTLPLILPFLITGAALAWARALGEFGATILFAGNLQGVTQTAPLAIYLGFETDLGQAKALAVILLACAALILVLVRVLLRRRLKLAH